MHRMKKLIAVALSVVTIGSASVIGSNLSAGASGTGAGLAEWALNAYYSGWSYVYGGSTPGAVDCSGLIWSYCGGNRVDMLGSSSEYGSVSAGIPRVHGLGLYQPGHVGVYVGDGMEVDARNEYYGVCYQSVASNWTGWSYWFKLAAVSYPTYGWEEFNGEYYYYEDGEYIVNTSRTIDGETYYFDASGVSSSTPSSDSSSSSSSSSESSGSSSSSSSSDSSYYDNTEEETKPAKKTVWSYGDSGDEVEKIQNRLAELGYYNGEIDGYFGYDTEAAYMAFQTAAGLVVDGLAGSDRDTLYSDDAPYAKVEEQASEDNSTDEAKAEQPEEETEAEAEKPALAQAGDFSDDVYDLQTRLIDLGYFGIEPTGFFGEYTSQAIAAFQAANGLEVTGELDEATYNALLSEDAVKGDTPLAYIDSYTKTNSGETATGPSQILGGSIAPSSLILSNEINSDYADKASDVVKKTNKVTADALAKSGSAIPMFSIAEVKRTASVWIWFVLTAAVLGAVSFILLKKNKKQSRYERYAAKRKRNSTRAQLNARW